MKVAHEHKVPLIVDNTFGMGGMHTYSRLSKMIVRSVYI
jgi:O-acetylhomoserine/O-acetylserine sulfhydrylase-like pyridoxal-dependent enzyme